MEGFVELTAMPSIHASVLAGALENEGVTVLLDRPALGSIYALESGHWATRVLVPAPQLERARTLLAEFDTPAN